MAHFVGVQFAGNQVLRVSMVSSGGIKAVSGRGEQSLKKP